MTFEDVQKLILSLLSLQCKQSLQRTRVLLRIYLMHKLRIEHSAYRSNIFLFSLFSVGRAYYYVTAILHIIAAIHEKTYRGRVATRERAFAILHYYYARAIRHINVSACGRVWRVCVCVCMCAHVYNSIYKRIWRTCVRVCVLYRSANRAPKKREEVGKR